MGQQGGHGGGEDGADGAFRGCPSKRHLPRRGATPGNCGYCGPLPEPLLNLRILVRRTVLFGVLGGGLAADGE